MTNELPFPVVVKSWDECLKDIMPEVYVSSPSVKANMKFGPYLLKYPQEM